MDRKNKKKGFVLLQGIMMVVIFIIIPGGSFALEKTSASAASNVTSVLKNGVFTVQGKGDMPDSARPKASQRNKIKKIVVKKGVTSLPEFAFKNCKKATSIKIASSVKRIGMQAFARTAVKSLTIPKTAEGIGWGICLDCDLLEKLVIPGDFSVLGPSSENWKEPFVTGKKSLETVKFSTELNLENVRMAGDCENFIVSPDDPFFKSIDGIIYTKDGKTLARIPYAREEAVIAEGCEIIAAGSFNYTADAYNQYNSYWGCGALKSIVLPSSVKEVTDKVYSSFARIGRDNREGSIKLNMAGLDIKSIKKLWKYCDWKKSLSDELARIGCADVIDGMVVLQNGYLCGYVGNRNQEEAVVPDSVKTIGESAFSEAWFKYGLNSVVLGSNVKSIKDYAFKMDKNIKIYIKSKNIKVSDKAFKDCGTYELITG